MDYINTSLSQFGNSGKNNSVGFERQTPSGKMAPEGVREDPSVAPDRAPDGKFVSKMREDPSIGRNEIGAFQSLGMDSSSSMDSGDEYSGSEYNGNEEMSFGFDGDNPAPSMDTDLPFESAKARKSGEYVDGGDVSFGGDPLENMDDLF